MVKQLDDTETLCKNSSHTTTPTASRNNGLRFCSLSHPPASLARMTPIK
ncbi:hypothetical protein [Rickettsia endosymbiont of Orchestes rusci]